MPFSIILEKLIGYFTDVAIVLGVLLGAVAVVVVPQRSAHLVDLASGDVVQLVRTLPCHGRGRGFESRRPRHFFQSLAAPISFDQRI
jgi:hypothetical protein